MIEATASTAEQPSEITIYVGVDDDDKTFYPDGWIDYYGMSVLHIRGPRTQLGPWTNRLLEWPFADGDDIIASFGDDHRPRTQGWDTKVKEAFVGMGSGLVYSKDGIHDEALPTAPFWSSDIIRELGFYFPTRQAHLYADDFWKAFGHALGRVTYLPNVLIEHCHHMVGKSERDEIYDSNDLHYPADEAAWEAYKLDGFDRDVARIKAILT
jgi:hypothetical protein